MIVICIAWGSSKIIQEIKGHIYHALHSISCAIHIYSHFYYKGKLDEIIVPHL